MPFWVDRTSYRVTNNEQSRFVTIDDYGQLLEGCLPGIAGVDKQKAMRSRYLETLYG